MRGELVPLLIPLFGISSSCFLDLSRHCVANCHMVHIATHCGVSLANGSDRTQDRTGPSTCYPRLAFHEADAVPLVQLRNGAISL